ncbi:hypothetical protein CAPTEDRAFT_219421 [Capitella teleta]|uniref:Carboxypeptidase n=1 Tax=Capitella teleta TaxID=283909 RepID=R7USK4_CAPTE|nr:hypothetical protein CAPTEDRAFT_219421 [Capitella teleta]|eukprot:ELU06391.1 hypothetical protein CAPTEDRAFT_219421 [Capitella teleta]
MSLLETLLILLIAATFTKAAIDADLVRDLPGLTFTPSFKQYSGYLKASSTKHLHYWFLEAETDAKNAPVVLWMNGGPGCSSLDGLLSEHGPFFAEDDGKTLKKNPYSWNKIANMLYMEAPAGVGFSYADDANYTTTDDETALHNHMALRDFLLHYPEFSMNEFFITGESYGGIYVPTLAARIVDDKDFNFKGFAVGNGLSDDAMNDNSIIYFGYYHGLFGTAVWELVVKYCCKNGCSTLGNCNFSTNKDKNCQNAVMQAYAPIQELNMYNMYAECYQGPDSAANATHPHEMFLFKNNFYIQHMLTACAHPLLAACQPPFSSICVGAMPVKSCNCKKAGVRTHQRGAGHMVPQDKPVQALEFFTNFIQNRPYQ